MRLVEVESVRKLEKVILLLARIAPRGVLGRGWYSSSDSLAVGISALSRNLMN